MAAEEELKYKVVIDASDVPNYLNSIQSQIDDSLGGGGMAQNMGMYSAPQIMAPAAMPISQADFGSLPQDAFAGGMGDWLKRSSAVMQEGYYKTKELAQSLALTAQVGRYELSNYFNTNYHPLSDMNAVQTMGVSLGFGYDPYNSMFSPGETTRMANQRLADNFTPGLSEFSVGDLTKEGAGLGMTIGGLIPGAGFAGMGIGAVIGGAAGLGMGLVNEVAKPFASEAIFSRNMQRGLRDYSKYAVSGALNYGDRSEIAEVLRTRDLDSDLLGTGTGRKDIEEMFQQLTQTNFFQQSGSKDEMIDKIKGFTKDFTDVMHVFKVAKEEVGKVVDTMNDVGLVGKGGMFGNNLGDASRYVEGLGYAARLDPNSSMQMFQTGAEMMRGTGIAMTSGGNLLLEQSAYIKNSVRDGMIEMEVINQQGGFNNAAINLSRSITDQATSTGGLVLGSAYLQGGVGGGASSTDMYASGLQGMTNPRDYFQTLDDVRILYGKPGMQDLIGLTKMAGEMEGIVDILGLKNEGQLVQAWMVRTGQDYNTAKLSVSRELSSPEAQYAPLVERTTKQLMSEADSVPSEQTKVSDYIGNFFAGGVRNTLGSMIHSSNTEISTFTPKREGVFGTEAVQGALRMFDGGDGKIDGEELSKFTTSVNGARYSNFRDTGYRQALTIDDYTKDLGYEFKDSSGTNERLFKTALIRSGSKTAEQSANFATRMAQKINEIQDTKDEDLRVALHIERGDWNKVYSALEKGADKTYGDHPQDIVDVLSPDQIGKLDNEAVRVAEAKKLLGARHEIAKGHILEIAGTDKAMFGDYKGLISLIQRDPAQSGNSYGQIQSKIKSYTNKEGSIWEDFASFPGALTDLTGITKFGDEGVTPEKLKHLITGTEKVMNDRGVTEEKREEAGIFHYYAERQLAAPIIGNMVAKVKEGFTKEERALSKEEQDKILNDPMELFQRYAKVSGAFTTGEQKEIATQFQAVKELTNQTKHLRESITSQGEGSMTNTEAIQLNQTEILSQTKNGIFKLVNLQTLALLKGKDKYDSIADINKAESAEDVKNYNNVAAMGL